MASKRLKQCQDDADGDYHYHTTDRLSCLPDPVIHHIFSYLPTSFAVRTSLCIKPLQHIWRSMFSLDLSDTDDPNLNFYTFLNSFIQGRDNSDIDKLRIRCGNLPKNNINQVKQVNKCLIYAMKNCQRIHALDLEVSNSYGMAKSYPFKMTRRILTCSSLKELKLSLGGFRIDFPTSIRLPLLTKLDLYRVKFHKHRQNEALFTQIPLLETLIIQDWKFSKNIKRLNICARRLKHLCILDHSLPNITFLTPNLVSLWVRCHYRAISFVENLVNLAIADLDVSVTKLPTSVGIQIVGADDQSMFDRTIRVLKSTHSLTLSSKFIQVRNLQPHLHSVFGSVKSKNQEHLFPFVCKLKLKRNIHYSKSIILILPLGTTGQVKQSCALLIKKEASTLSYNRIPLSNLKCLKLKTEFLITSMVCINTIQKNSPNIETLEISQFQKAPFEISKSGEIEDEYNLGYDYQFMNLKSVFLQNMDLTGISEVTFLLHLLKTSVVLQNVVLDQPLNLGNFKKGEIEPMLLKLPPASRTVQILVK